MKLHYFDSVSPIISLLRLPLLESWQIILELAWKPAFQILALTLDVSKLFNFFDVKLLHLWNWKK